MEDADKDFKYRNTDRMDIAHIKAIEFLDEHKIYYKNIGFDPKEDTVPSDIWFQVPSFLRNTPDMFVVTKKGFSLLEAKGCKDTLKIKIEDYLQYIKWNNHGRLMFFIYSTTKDSRYLFSLEALEYKFKNASVGQYDDNAKMYFEIDLETIKVFLV